MYSMGGTADLFCSINDSADSEDSEDSGALEDASNSASNIAARSPLSDDVWDCCDVEASGSMVTCYVGGVRSRILSDFEQPPFSQFHKPSVDKAVIADQAFLLFDRYTGMHSFPQPPYLLVS